MILDKIRNKDFLEESIKEIKKENPSADIQLLEKTIGAIYLAENLDLFTRYEENKRKNSASERMDLKHYKFFFNSVTDNTEKYILLDIAFESNEYPQIVRKKIKSNILKLESKMLAYIPSVERSEKNNIDKFDTEYKIDEQIIPNEYRKKLKTIKKVNEEAYYYILKSFQN